MDIQTDTASNNITENKWKSFDARGLHFIHLNINSRFDKIVQLRFIAEKSKPTLIGITDSKIADETVTETEFDIDGYTTIRNERTRHGDVVLYIKEFWQSRGLHVRKF